VPAKLRIAVGLLPMARSADAIARLSAHKTRCHTRALAATLQSMTVESSVRFTVFSDFL